MAARRFTQFFYTLLAKPVKLFLHATIGAAGAPTLVSDDSKGIASITRTGAGAYTIVLSDQYMKFLSMGYTFLKVGAEDIKVQINSLSMTTKTITVITSAAGVATDPSNGSELYLEFTLSNSSID